MRQWYHDDGDNGDRHIITWKGQPVKSINAAWVSSKKTAGITRRLRLYDLRHAFVTYLLEAGADLKAVSSLVGHTNTVTTTRVYQHINMGLMRSTIAKLPDIDGNDHTSSNT